MSKFMKFEDLSLIVIYGFWGEVLVSISYVVYVVIIIRIVELNCVYKVFYFDGKFVLVWLGLFVDFKFCVGNKGM